MPRLAPGGKWVYGRVLVDNDRRIRIPQDAWAEYGFRDGEQVLFLRGSRTSGGFAVGKPTGLGPELARRTLGSAMLQDGRKLELPEDLDVKPGQVLIAVRGSGKALALIAQGPVFDFAVDYPGLAEFHA